MYSKGFKTILLFLSLGFLIIWFLEFRRTGLADSYWLLLMVLICLLWYQLINLKTKASNQELQQDEVRKPESRKKEVTKTSKRRK